MLNVAWLAVMFSQIVYNRVVGNIFGNILWLAYPMQDCSCEF